MGEGDSPSELLSGPTAIIAKSLGRYVDELRANVAEAWAWPSGEASFARFAYSVCDEEPPIELSNALPSLPADRATEAPVLAAYGYVVASDVLREADTHMWKDGVIRLAQKKVVVDRRTTFAYRPAELLGLAVGLSKAEGMEEQREWLGKVVLEVEAAYREYGTWERVVGGLAAALMGRPWTDLISSDVGVVGAAVALWVLDAYPREAEQLALVGQYDTLLGVLLRGTVSAPPPETDIAQAAIIGITVQNATLGVVENAIDWHTDPDRRERAGEDKRRIDRIERRSINSLEEAKRTGRRYRGVALAALTIVYAGTLTVGMVAFYGALGQSEWFEANPTWKWVLLIVVLVALAVFGYSKTPIKKWATSFGAWRAQRVENRIHGRDRETVESL